MTHAHLVRTWLLCVLTYFFKLYQIFFKSAFLVVCDITIFSKRYHDFFKWNFTIFSNGFLNWNHRNKLWIYRSQTDKTGLNQGKISRFFNWISHNIVWLAIIVSIPSIWLFIEISVFLIVLSGMDMITCARGA